MLYCPYLESEVFSLTRKKVFIIVLCAVIGVFLLICALFAILRAALPTLYYRIYPFARISGTVTVTVDGEPYVLQADSISAEENASFSQTPQVRLHADGSAQVAIRAGKYGGYGFLVSVDGVEHPMNIASYQANWWNVTKFDLRVTVDTAAGTVTLESAAQLIGEDGSPYPLTYSETYSLSDPDIRFAVAWI